MVRWERDTNETCVKSRRLTVPRMIPLPQDLTNPVLTQRARRLPGAMLTPAPNRAPRRLTTTRGWACLTRGAASVAAGQRPADAHDTPAPKETRPQCRVPCSHSPPCGTLRTMNVLGEG